MRWKKKKTVVCRKKKGLDELKKEDYNPLLVVKSFGQKVGEISALHEHFKDGLEDDTLCIILQTEHMLDVLIDHQHVLTMDATHNTTKFSCVKLITIMAIDTNRNIAYPVAFCIPDNEKKTCICLLIQSIKKRAKI